jgi:hypothetical protein
MDSRHEIRPATKRDLILVATKLRAADREEQRAVGHTEPLAVYRAMIHATEANIATDNIEPVCAFGLGAPIAFGHEAHPWMLGTDLMLNNRHTFIRESRKIVAAWRERFAVLSNYVDARNTVSIAWLRWLGFTIGDAVPYGPFGLPFHRFEMRS